MARALSSHLRMEKAVLESKSARWHGFTVLLSLMKINNHMRFSYFYVFFDPFVGFAFARSRMPY